MKKQMKVIGFAALSSLFVVGNAMAEEMFDVNQICPLIAQFKNIFKVLRTLAFVGAGFIIAGWGWSYISKTEEVKMDDVKKKGFSMLIGFALLFGIGILLDLLSKPSMVTGALGCDTELFGNW